MRCRITIARTSFDAGEYVPRHAFAAFGVTDQSAFLSLPLHRLRDVLLDCGFN